MTETTIDDWLAALTAAGVQLWFEGNRLRFRAPAGALLPAQRDRLAARRGEVVEHLRRAAAVTERSAALSPSQQSLWFIHMQAPESVAYHVTFSVRVCCQVDMAALQQAVQAVVDRHAILRTTYPVTDGSPRQRIAGWLACVPQVTPLFGASEEELHAEVVREAHRPFDLENGPVVRVSLISRADDDHVLLLAAHHIAVDGWSVMLLLDELIRLYAEASQGTPTNLAIPDVTYEDYVAWHERLLAGPEGEKLWAYWERKLAAPRDRAELPLDHPRPAHPKFPGGSVPLRVTSDVVTQLKAIATQENTTLFVVMLATFHAFVHRATGSHDVIVGSPTFARSKEEFMRVIGDFVNSVALRASVGPELTFRGLVAQLRGTVHEALAAQDAPFPMLVQRLSPERDQSRSPLFDTFFNLTRFEQFRELEPLRSASPTEQPLTLGGLKLAPYVLVNDGGQFDLSLQMAERPDGLFGLLNYNAELFESQTARYFAEAYGTLVERVASDPELGLSALPVCAPETTAGLIRRLRAADIRLTLDAGALKVNAPKGAITPELKATIGARRDELIAELSKEPSATGPEAGSVVRPIARTGSLPVSAAQRRLWFFDRMEPGRAQYNIGGIVRLRGVLHAELLQRSVDQLVRRHESLRTQLGEADGEPELSILATVSSALELFDLSHLGADGALAEAQSRLAKRLRDPFEIAHAPLARYVLVRFAPDDHLLALFMHHVVADGWSLLIAVRELLEGYAEAARGRAQPRPPLTLQYVDYAGWEIERLHAGRMGAQLSYWKRQLANAPTVLELPSDRPRPPRPSFRGHRLRKAFDTTIFSAIKQLSRSHEATLFMTLLGAFQLLLHRYSGQDDVVVGSPVSNRGTPALEGVVGCFVNNLAFRAQFTPGMKFSELLQQVKQTTFAALEHAELPFDVLVDGLRLDRAANHAPVFQVLFALQSYFSSVSAPEGLSIDLHAVPDLDIGVARFDLAIELAEVEGRLMAMYEFASDLFDQDTIERMHANFERLLGSIAVNPDCPIENLAMLSDTEQSYLLEAYNDTALAFDRERCLHQLVEARARLTPDSIAVLSGDETLSYRELDERANQLSQLLVAEGVQPGALVAVCVDRTVDMPIAILAVTKSGAAYVPLDPSHPRDRLHYTLEDAGVRQVITVSRFAPLLEGTSAPLLLLDREAARLAASSKAPPTAVVDPAQRAYVIYTSGSTGKPKGVEVEHRHVVAFLEAMRLAPGLDERDRLLAVTTLSFDIAGLELWLPLSVGARVVIASRSDVLDGERLAQLLERHDVTVLQATPATFRLMIDGGWEGKANLKVLCGGEAMPRDLALSLHARVAELWNMYGPTETTIWSTVSKIEDPAEAITVGKPIHNTQVYLLDAQNQPTPIGVPGELCIAGEGVARGYLNRPELTAEKFVTLSLAGGKTVRMYRTGDMARIRGDGRIDFIGRRDHQVKVRGYRIELGEIEVVLASHPGVKRGVVMVREDEPGDQRLVGYVVTQGGTFDDEAARATLRTKLPEYMVPSIFLVLDELPLTHNGKIDRKALPAPATQTESPAHEQAVALMTPVQQRVAKAWREVLKSERVGLYDNFFDMGGHSLLLVKLHAALRREFGGDLTLVELFQWTTVAAQAERLSASGGSNVALQRAQARAARLNDG